MSEFVRVPDSFREDRPRSSRTGRVPSPIAAALIDGQTIFVPMNGRTRHQIVSAAGMAVRRHGWQGVRSFEREHNGTGGVVLWAVRVSPS